MALAARATGYRNGFATELFVEQVDAGSHKERIKIEASRKQAKKSTWKCPGCGVRLLVSVTECLGCKITNG